MANAKRDNKSDEDIETGMSLGRALAIGASAYANWYHTKTERERAQIESIVKEKVDAYVKSVLAEHAPPRRDDEKAESHETGAHAAPTTSPAELESFIAERVEVYLGHLAPSIATAIADALAAQTRILDERMNEQVQAHIHAHIDSLTPEPPSIPDAGEITEAILAVVEERLNAHHEQLTEFTEQHESRATLQRAEAERIARDAATRVLHDHVSTTPNPAPTPPGLDASTVESLIAERLSEALERETVPVRAREVESVETEDASHLSRILNDTTSAFTTNKSKNPMSFLRRPATEEPAPAEMGTSKTQERHVTASETTSLNEDVEDTAQDTVEEAAKETADADADAFIDDTPIDDAEDHRDVAPKQTLFEEVDPASRDDIQLTGPLVNFFSSYIGPRDVTLDAIDRARPEHRFSEHPAPEDTLNADDPSDDEPDEEYIGESEYGEEVVDETDLDDHDALDEIPEDAAKESSDPEPEPEPEPDPEPEPEPEPDSTKRKHRLFSRRKSDERASEEVEPDSEPVEDSSETPADVDEPDGFDEPDEPDEFDDPFKQHLDDEPTTPEPLVIDPPPLPERKPDPKESTKTKSATSRPAGRANDNVLNTSGPTWRRPVNGNCPEGYPVKAKYATGRYHLPEDRGYERIRPDCCYATTDEAEQDGFKHSFWN